MNYSSSIAVESNKSVAALDCKYKTGLHLINEKLAGGKLDSPAAKKMNDKLKTDINKTVTCTCLVQS